MLLRSVLPWSKITAVVMDRVSWTFDCIGKRVHGRIIYCRTHLALANYGSSSNNIPVGTGSGSFGQYNSGYRARAPRNSAFGVQGSRSAWPRVKKPPRPPVDPSQFFCETCNITCGGPAAWQEHLVGKSHKRKEETAKSAQQAHSGKSNYKCDICNVSCTGKDSFETHVNGVKHSRASAHFQLDGFLFF